MGGLLLSGCAEKTPLPVWKITATTKSLLQTKQVNSPVSGKNYILCAHCVKITKINTNFNKGVFKWECHPKCVNANN